MTKTLELKIDISEAFVGWPTMHTAVSVFVPDDQVDPPAVFLFPGAGSSRRSFDVGTPGYPGFSMARYLAGAGYVVACCDHLSVGDSSHPDPAALTIEVLARANHTGAPVKNTSQNSASPVRLGMGRTSTPSVGNGHKRKVMRWCFGASGSVRAGTRMPVPSRPRDIQIF